MYDESKVKNVMVIEDPKLAAAITSLANRSGRPDLRGYPVKGYGGGLSFIFDNKEKVEEVIQNFTKGVLVVNALEYYDTLNEIEYMLEPEPFGVPDSKGHGK